MKSSWFARWLFIASLLALAGCRERNLEGVPAVEEAPQAVSDPGPDPESVEAQSRSVGEASEPVHPEAISEQRSIELAGISDLAFACNFDSVGDQFFEREIAVDQNRPIVLRGWGALSEKRAPSRISVLLSSAESTWSIEAKELIARPDVVHAFNVGAMLESGFNIRTSLQPLPGGRYAVSLLVHRDDRVERCDTGKFLILEKLPS